MYRPSYIIVDLDPDSKGGFWPDFHIPLETWFTIYIWYYMAILNIVYVYI